MSPGVVWEGPLDLRPLLVPVGELRTHPGNPRRGDVKMIAKSLSAFGQLKPVIVHDLDGQETIFAGNHTYRAAVELGWSHVAASRPAYLSDEEAERYLLMDNRSSDLATYDYGELAAILEERQEAGQLDRTGFTADDVDRMRAEAAQLAGAALDEFRQARDEDDGDVPPGPPSSPPAPLRQVVLTFDPAVYDGLVPKLQALAKAYGTDDVAATILEALRRAVAAA